ncbi:MAG: Lactamase protein [Anaerolineales bacterium]|nr:Lactamase protein [Anaerolineales bacterium]
MVIPIRDTVQAKRGVGEADEYGSWNLSKSAILPNTMPSVDIHPLDLRFQNSPEGIAAYLVIGPGGPVLVETGPGSTVPTLEQELARFGLTSISTMRARQGGGRSRARAFTCITSARRI